MPLFGKRRHRTEHHAVGELLSAYLDGEVSPRERQMVEAHLASCEACRWDLQTLRQTVQWAGELPPVPLPRVFTIPAPVAAPARPARRRSWGRGLLQGATALVALLLVVAILGDFVLTGFLPRGVPEVGSVEQEQAVEVTGNQVTEEVMTVVLEMEAPAPAADEAEIVPTDAAAAPQPSPLRQVAPTATPSPEMRGMSEPGLEAAPQEEGQVTASVAAKAAPTAVPGSALTDDAPPGEKALAGEEAATPTPAPTTLARVDEPLAQPAPADEEPAEATWQQTLAPWLRLVEIGLALAFVVLATLTIVVVLRSRMVR